MNFVNALYEYTTRETATDRANMGAMTLDLEMRKEGWSRAWADITLEGTFIVYRRAKV